MASFRGIPDDVFFASACPRPGAFLSEGSMTVRLSTGARNALAGETGFGKTFETGVIYIYSGPQPLSADNGHK